MLVPIKGLVMYTKFWNSLELSEEKKPLFNQSSKNLLGKSKFLIIFPY